MPIRREDSGFLRIYRLDGQIGSIFYRTFPSTETLASIDVSIASRLSPGANENVLDRLISKSKTLIEKATPSYDGSFNIDDTTSVNLFFENYEKNLDVSSRKTLYNLNAVLGHRNIAEQSHMMISMAVPLLSALRIQDETFVASQERSTRYVDFKETYVPSADEDIKSILINGYDALSSVYNSLYEVIYNLYEEDFKRKNGRSPSEQEGKNIIRPSVLDQTRSFLQMGQMTSLVLQISARTAENIGRKLLSSNNKYDQMVGVLFDTVVSDNVPSLSTHLEPDEYNKEIYKKERIAIDLSKINEKPRIKNLEEIITKIGGGSQTEEQMINSIYYQMPIKPGRNKKEAVSDYLKRISSKRQGKYDDLNDSLLRSTFLQLNINCSLGTARDFWRHRLSKRNLDVNVNEYFVPNVVYENKDMYDTVRAAFLDVNQNMRKLYDKGANSEAELLIPLATAVDLKMSMSLAEAVFIAENRSTSEAHPEYKRIAYQILDALR
ncbi:MAG: FAD-dependent thymidylate synthase, partial [Nanoarchaeota archaeon]|nr:FAD-dependent thymidylate synthase [Nanoarchaeota archaeon]